MWIIVGSVTAFVMSQLLDVYIFGAFKNIIKAQKFSPEVRTLFLISFLVNAGMAFFYSFFNVYLTNKFGFSPAEIGNFFAYVGLWVIITQVVVVRHLAKKHKEIDILGPTYFLYALGVLLYLVPNKAWMLLLVVPIASIPNGVQMANFSALLSKKTEEKMRGEVMGVNSSVSSLGQAIPPIIAGFVAAATATFVPIVFGALIVVVAGFIFVQKIKNAKI